MNLPLVVDIAIGLIFIYLVFSLLTSEIQELITTLLQWRAVHLKESIEGLLAGGNETPQLKQARLLTNRLYESPVINTLNQEAKGIGATVPRRFTRAIGKFIREIFKRDNVFGEQNSGPSYVASESFATSLMEILGIPSVIEKFTVLRIQDFNSRLIAQVESALQKAAIAGINQQTLKLDLEDEAKIENLLRTELNISDPNQTLPILKQFYNFKNKLSESIKAFQNKGMDLKSSVDRLEEVFGLYVEGLEEYFKEKDTNSQPNSLVTSLKAIQTDTFGKPQTDNAVGAKTWSSEKTLLLRNLQPNLTEAVEIVQSFWQLKKCWSAYKKVRKGAALDAVSKITTTIESQSNISEPIKKISFRDT